MVKYIKQFRKYGLLDMFTPSVDLTKYGTFPDDVYHSHKAIDRLSQEDLNGDNGFIRKIRRKHKI